MPLDRPTFWHVPLRSFRQSLLAYHAGLGCRGIKLGRVCGLMLIWKHLHMPEVTGKDKLQPCFIVGLETTWMVHNHLDAVEELWHSRLAGKIGAKKGSTKLELVPYSAARFKGADRFLNCRHQDSRVSAI